MNTKEFPDPKSIDDLLREYQDHGQRSIEGITPMHFKGREIENQDIYNPSRTLTIGGNQYIFARVEPRDSEVSQVILFKKDKEGIWHRDESLLPFDNLQDPFVTRIGDEYVFGGVQYPIEIRGKYQTWRTVFYKGKDIFSLEKFVETPLGMKCARLVELKDKNMGLFTRPQSPKEAPEWHIGGRGKIGFIKLPNIEALASLTEKDYHDPKTLINSNGMFIDDEWGGVNDTHLLENGRVLVFGHIARYKKSIEIKSDSGITPHKLYFPMVFVYDPKINRASTPTIIATRKDFHEDAPSKHFSLHSVVYKGGANISDAGIEDGEHYIHMSIGDACSYDQKLRSDFLKEVIEKSETELA